MMKTTILFPGYGAQNIGMGQTFYENYPNIKKTFNDASSYLNIDFKDLCFYSNNDKLNQIDNAYLSIFLISCSIYDVLKQNNIEATFVAGYDTGQYAALYAANSITLSEGLGILKKYSEFYINLLDKNNYEILKVNGLTSTKLPTFLDNRTSIASYQSRTQHLVSGTKEGIESLCEKLKNASGVTLYNESIGLGLNSNLMDPIVEKIAPHLNKMNFKDLDIPLISNDDGSKVTQGKQVREEIIRLINTSIKWDNVVDKLSDAELIIGIGSQDNLLDLVKEKYPRKNILSVQNVDDLEKIKTINQNFGESEEN